MCMMSVATSAYLFEIQDYIKAIASALLSLVFAAGAILSFFYYIIDSVINLVK